MNHVNLSMLTLTPSGNALVQFAPLNYQLLILSLSKTLRRNVNEEKRIAAAAATAKMKTQFAKSLVNEMEKQCNV